MSEENFEKLIESQEIIFQRLSEIYSDTSSSLINYDNSTQQKIGNAIAENSTVFTSDKVENSLKTFALKDNTQKNDKKRSSQKNSKEVKNKRSKSNARSRLPPKKRKNNATKSQSILSNQTASKFVEVKKNESDAEISSEDSVSLLRECYEESENYSILIRNNLQSDQKVTQANDESKNTKISNPLPKSAFDEIQNIGSSFVCDLGTSENVFDDQTHFGDPISDRRNKSCQTETLMLFKHSLNVTKEENITYHARFLASVVKLKYLLSSKADVSKDALCRVLNKERDLDFSFNSQEENVVSRDTLKYLLRSAKVDMVFQETVSSLLYYLETALEKDLENLAIFWKGSVYELAVKILNKAILCELKLKKLTDSFINKVITSILDSAGEMKDLTQETKAAFIVKFCDCVYHSQSAIDHIINKIKILNVVKYSEGSSLTDKHVWSRITKNSYYLLRTLTKLLILFQAQSKGEESEKFDDRRDEKIQNYNILEMWKKHWRQGEALKKGNQSSADQIDCTAQQCRSHTSKWCEDLNEILVHCVEHLPVLVNPVEKCVRLAGNIVMENHLDTLNLSPRHC